MKSFKQFLTESINISGDFNGTLIVGGENNTKQEVGEEFTADVLWQGSLYRIEMVTKDGIPSRTELAEHLQGEYPGIVVQQIYPVDEENSSIQVKNTKRYHPAKLDWV